MRHSWSCSSDSSWGWWSGHVYTTRLGSHTPTHASQTFAAQPNPPARTKSRQHRRLYATFDLAGTPRIANSTHLKLLRGRTSPKGSSSLQSLASFARSVGLALLWRFILGRGYDQETWWSLALELALVGSISRCILHGLLIKSATLKRRVMSFLVTVPTIYACSWCLRRLRAISWS